MRDSKQSLSADSCASILKVLAVETRLAVVGQLLGGPKSVGELNEELLVESTLLSHHLRVLREAEIVETERNGKQVIYRLAKSIMKNSRGKSINLGCCKLTF